MRNFDVLSKKTDIFGTKFLEASAGTGKTFAIEHIFVRLLIQGKNPLLIEEILVVTFTKKATRELKDRIKENIEKAISILSLKKENPLFPYLSSYFSDKKALSLLKNALASFDEVQIFTIHGFCYSMLQKFPIQADVLLSGEKEYFNNLQKEVFDYFEHLTQKSKAQLSLFFQGKKEFSFLEKLISFRKQEDYEPYFEIFKNFKKKVFQFDAEIRFLKEDICTMMQSFKKEIPKNLFFHFSLFKKLLKTKKCNIKIFEKILFIPSSFYTFVAAGKKTIQLKNHLFFEYIEKILLPLIIKAKDKKNIFYDIAEDFSLFLEKRFLKKDILSFDDILKKMQKALLNEIFLKKIQNRYKAVFIDEFQDTDPVQWDIFQKIFLKKDTIAFYLIGDPKQSIYSFRNADLYTYMSAKESFKGSLYSLNTNFRSSSHLLKGLNAIFSKKSCLNLPRMNKEIPYMPSLSSFQSEGTVPKISFFKIEGRSKGRSWPSEVIEKKYFYPYIGHKIEEYRRKGILYENMAILVKDRFQAKNIQEYLLKKNIPSFTKSREPLFHTKAASFLKDIFLAAFSFKDSSKVAIALYGKYIQYPLKQLTEKELIFGMQNFSYLHKILKKEGLSYFFHSFFEMIFQKETVYQKMVREEPSFYLHTMQIMDYLLQLDSMEKLSFQDIIDQFEERLLDQRVVEFQKMQDSVCIMTIHSSKGLEFDLVFALGLAKRSKISYEENISEKNAEKLRQFYVALTRAKKRLFVPYAKDLSKISKKENFSPIEIFFDTEDFLEDLQKKSLVVIDDIEKMDWDFSFKKKTNLLQKPKEVLLSFDKKPIFSFSSIFQKEKDSFFVKEEKEKTFLAKDLGTLVHEIFEKLLSGKHKNFYDHSVIKNICKKQIEKKEIEVDGDFVFSLIKNGLSTPLFEKGFSIKNVPIENMHTEVEFFIKEDDFYKGFIDLIFFYQKRYYLIDWKSNFLGDDLSCYKDKKLKDAMQKNNYFLQATIYKKALKKMIETKGENFSKVFGGVFYLFLRGQAVYKIKEEEFLDGR